MTLTLDQLRESNVPLDWMTVKVGYDGVGESWFSLYYLDEQLQRSEIMDYALDVLASAIGTPDEYPIFLLVDADPTNRMALNNPLELLAERSGVTRENALRKWRYAAIHKFVRTFQPSNHADEDWEYECCSAYYSLEALKEHWNEGIFAHPLPLISSKDTKVDWEDALTAEIALLRAWLSDEHPKLL